MFIHVKKKYMAKTKNQMKILKLHLKNQKEGKKIRWRKKERKKQQT